jgi:hypothetical protein
MKATIVLGIFSAVVTSAGLAAEHGVRLVEPAAMLLSGAALLALASAVRRYVP